MKKSTKLLIIATFTFILSFSTYSICFAADPTIIKNLSSALTQIKKWIISFATPAAAIGVGTGVLIKKFSFGDEERIIVGRRLIRQSLTSYALIIGIDLILKAIDSLIT